MIYLVWKRIIELVYFRFVEVEQTEKLFSQL